uniref:DNA-directed RNA polymerase subunit A n=1 Tax=Lygus hesperus TaxID=30085 RepID=A0A0A9Y846_LYGHE
MLQRIQSDETASVSTHLVDNLLQLTNRTIQYVVNEISKHELLTSRNRWLAFSAPNNLWKRLEKYTRGDHGITANSLTDTIRNVDSCISGSSASSASSNELEVLHEIRTTVSIEYTGEKKSTLLYNSSASLTSASVSNSPCSNLPSSAAAACPATAVQHHHPASLRLMDTPLQSWYYNFNTDTIGESTVPRVSIDSFTQFDVSAAASATSAVSVAGKSAADGTTFNRRDVLATLVPSPDVPNAVESAKSVTAVGTEIPDILYDNQVRQCLALCHRILTKTVRWSPETVTSAAAAQDMQPQSPHQAHLRKGVPFAVVFSPPPNQPSKRLKGTTVVLHSPVSVNSPTHSTNSTQSAIALLSGNLQQEILRNNQQQKHLEREKLVQQQQILYFLNSLLSIYTTVRSMLLLHHRNSAVPSANNFSCGGHDRILGDSLENVLAYLTSKSTVPQYTRGQYFRSLVYLSTVASEFCFVGTFKQSTLFVVRIDMHRDTIVLYKLLQRLIHAQTEIITLIVQHHWTLSKLQQHIGWDSTASHLIAQFGTICQFFQLSMQQNVDAGDLVTSVGPVRKSAEYDVASDTADTIVAADAFDISFTVRELLDDFDHDVDTEVAVEGQSRQSGSRKLLPPMRHSTGDVRLSSRRASIKPNALVSPFTIRTRRRV